MRWDLFVSALTEFEREQLQAELHQYSVDTAAVGAEEVRLIRAGKLVDAMKSLRTRTGIGLKEARDLVHAHQEAQG